jgi:hypothetical protein
VRAPGGCDLPPDAAKELPYAGIDSRFIEAESAKMGVRVRDTRVSGPNAKQFAVTLHRDIDGVPEVVGALPGDASRSH